MSEPVRLPTMLEVRVLGTDGRQVRPHQHTTLVDFDRHEGVVVLKDVVFPALPRRRRSDVRGRIATVVAWLRRDGATVRRIVAVQVMRPADFRPLVTFPLDPGVDVRDDEAFHCHLGHVVL